MQSIGNVNWKLHLIKGTFIFLEWGVGWRNSGEGSLTFSLSKNGRVSINLTHQRGGSLKFYCFPGEGHIF